MTGVALVLAHQGGWDEVLLILTPIVLFAGLLALANRRANAEQARRDDTGPASDHAVDETPARRDDDPG